MDNKYKTMTADDFNPNNLDEGIREVVVRLRAEGFVTCDSGDGGSKLKDGWEESEVIPVPHVYIECEVADLIRESDRLNAWLEAQGYKSANTVDINDDFNPFDPGVIYVEGTYLPGQNKTAIIGLFGLTGKHLPEVKIDNGK